MLNANVVPLSPVQIRSIITNILIIMDNGRHYLLSVWYHKWPLFNNEGHHSWPINGTPWCARFILWSFRNAVVGMRAYVYIRPSIKQYNFCFIFWGCLRFHLWNNNTDPTIAWLSQVDAYSCAVLYCDNSPYYFPCLSSRPRIPRCALLFLLLFCCFCNFNHDCSNIFYRLFLM